MSWAARATTGDHRPNTNLAGHIPSHPAANAPTTVATALSTAMPAVADPSLRSWLWRRAFAVRSLAEAVPLANRTGPERAEALPGRHFQIQAVHRDDIAVGLLKVGHT